MGRFSRLRRLTRLNWGRRKRVKDRYLTGERVEYLSPFSCSKFLKRSTSMRTWRDNHPTGRKHCSHCTRWRLLLDFTVRTWADEPICAIPRVFSSVCRVCSKLKNRARKGHAPRELYRFGSRDSEKAKAHRREMNRASDRRRRKKKAYRKKQEEYRRIWRDAKIAERERQACPIESDY